MEIQALTAEAAVAAIPALVPVAAAIFDDGDRFEDLQQDAAEKPGLLLLLAWEGDDCLGFKAGYRRNETTFYSWLGGVLQEARGQGIARRLMLAQHEWVADQGYRYVTTETYNRYREMLLLNIRMGFDVVGTQTMPNGEPKIMLRRALTTSES
ncbi:GNAT family N-acetyltransferase [Deinococcus sp.]|uniref:GNAT family N-acetyltransferase n=1 Tax=Deinococcus sp. TaxID=47478 RepID=UPI003C7BB851